MELNGRIVTRITILAVKTCIVILMSGMLTAVVGPMPVSWNGLAAMTILTIAVLVSPVRETLGSRAKSKQCITNANIISTKIKALEVI